LAVLFFSLINLQLTAAAGLKRCTEDIQFLRYELIELQHHFRL